MEHLNQILFLIGLLTWIGWVLFKRYLNPDLDHHHTFRLFADGSGDGLGPSGSRHARFRAWKEDLLGR